MTHHDLEGKKDPYARQRKEDQDRNKFIPGYQTPDVYQQTDEEKYAVVEPTPPTEGGPQKPIEGVVLHDGWGAKKDPSTWKIVNMKDRPQLFKVVDDDGKNVITDFTTSEIAQQYIDWAKSTPYVPPITVPDEGDVDEPDTTPDEPPVVGVKGTGPYPGIGKELESKIRGPTIRHYQSGKDDDKTVEMNVKGIRFDNYQFITYVTIKSIEHDDTISLKYGGTHMSSGWFDTGVGFEDGQICLGTEEKHPSTDLCIAKGPKIGSILNKKLGVAGIYFKPKNKLELWTDLGDGWKKQLSGIDVGGFNPGSAVNEAQLRIDGFEDLPKIHSAVVQEIAPDGGTTSPSPSPAPTPNPQPQPTPSPSPAPSTGGIIEDGVKMFHPKIGEPVTFVYKSSNPGRAQFIASLPSGFINLEVTGYLNIKGVSNEGEEVSIKTRGGPHGDNAPLGSCYISGIGYDGTVNNQYEQPHPNNHAMSLHGKAGKFDPGNIIGKWFGMKNIVYFDGSKDVIQLYLDMDGLDAAGKPANNWKLFWETTSTQFANKQNGEDQPKTYFRLDDIEGDPKSNVELKFATVREITP